jgi:hypothetical protein
MLGDHAQNTPGLRFIAADRLSQLRPEQINYRDPSRPDDMHMRRRVVIGINDDP